MRVYTIIFQYVIINIYSGFVTFSVTVFIGLWIATTLCYCPVASGFCVLLNKSINQSINQSIDSQCLWHIPVSIIHNKRLWLFLQNSCTNCVFEYKAKPLSWTRGVPMASRRGRILLAVFYSTRVLPVRLATVSAQGLCLVCIWW